MKNKVSNFLFPIKVKNVGNGKSELVLTFRFGWLSVVLWKIFCWVTNND